MKTPEEIKKGLECRIRGVNEKCDYRCDKCDIYIPGYNLENRYSDALAYIQQLEDAVDKTTQLMQSATEVIKKSQEQLESTYSQVKKSLCGKENASWVEVLEAANQLKTRLAQAERERDAAINDCGRFPCRTCMYEGHAAVCYICHGVPGGGRVNYEWRGPCPENTKEE